MFNLPMSYRSNEVSMRLFDMVGCLSSAMDLVSPEVVGHHIRVGAIAFRLGEVAGLPGRQCSDLALAGMLHDIGAFSLKGRIETLAFESDDQTHPEIGYRLLHGFPEFARAAQLVRTHHCLWSRSGQPRKVFLPELELGNLLCLADRVDTLLPRSPGAPFNRDALLKRIRTGSGRMFNPWWVEALETLAAQDDFLEKAASLAISRNCLRIPDEHNPELSGRKVSQLARLFSQVIDFRCRFTATHSRGVAATTMLLARELHMDGDERDCLEVASELHDLGKLGVPSEIIMKPAALNAQEMATMQRHAEHGYHVLSGLTGLAGVATLVVQHHERLDGKGYPYGTPAAQIGLASRVLAVSDVFTALGEDRPYRAGMEISRIVSILQEQADHRALDPDVVSLISSRRHDLDAARRHAQDLALADFDRFTSGLAP